MLDVASAESGVFRGVSVDGAVIAVGPNSGGEGEGSTANIAVVWVELA